jgi:hypothetical protein
MDFLAGQGARRNNNGGNFVQGIAYGFEKKLEVTDAYRRRLEEGGLHAFQVAIAKECKVSGKFVVKIISKLIEHGKILRQSEIQTMRRVDPGEETICKFSSFVLFRLYLAKPSHSRASY